VASQLLHQIEIATGLETFIDPLVPKAVESLLGLTAALSVKLSKIAGKSLYKAFGTSVKFGQKAVAAAICFCAISHCRPLGQRFLLNLWTTLLGCTSGPDGPRVDLES
jgi:hypothetical protein